MSLCNLGHEPQQREAYLQSSVKSALTKMIDGWCDAAEKVAIVFMLT